MQANKFLVFIFVVLLTSASNATLIEVSVETDKDIYLLGEDVTVFVTAYNPNQEPVTLGFGSSLTATYLMDGVLSARVYDISFRWWYPVCRQSC